MLPASDHFDARRLLLAVITCLAPAPAVAGDLLPDGAALHRALQGLWCNSHDQGRSCWAWDEFRADGTFAACGRTEAGEPPFRGAGSFSVDGQRMCYVVTTASDNFWLRPGQRYCTDIVAIDRQTHRYRDIDTGAEYTLYRRDAGERRCP